MRSTHECEQMNAVYRSLDELQPSPDQIRALRSQALQDWSAGDATDKRACELFLHQLWVHVQKRNEQES